MAEQEATPMNLSYRLQVDKIDMDTGEHKRLVIKDGVKIEDDVILKEGVSNASA